MEAAEAPASGRFCRKSWQMPKFGKMDYLKRSVTPDALSHVALWHFPAIPGSRRVLHSAPSCGQAIGTKSGNAATGEVLKDFIVEARESGLVANLIVWHGVGCQQPVACDL